MRELTEKEKKAFLIVNRLSHYGMDSVNLLSDVLKDLILNDEIEYTESRLLNQFPHLLKDNDKDYNYYYDGKNTYADYEAIKKWEFENENANKVR